MAILKVKVLVKSNGAVKEEREKHQKYAQIWKGKMEEEQDHERLRVVNWIRT